MQPRDRRFAIFRDGDEIGRHEVRFVPSADGLRVETDIDIAVKIAFITVFHFGQNAREHWRDGLLVDSNVVTDDNGTKSETSLQAQGDALSVEGGIENRVLRVPLGTMPDIAFWHLAIVRERSLLDMQRAQLVGLVAQPSGLDEIEVAGARIAARRFTIAADTGRSGDIWYDEADNWVKGSLVTRGETLDYHLLG